MIPQVAGAVRFSVRTEVFQISFSEPFRVVFIGTLATLELLCLSAGAQNELWLLLGVLPTTTAVLSALSVAVLVWRYKFSVGPDGLSCYDFWCQPLTTGWNDMRTVSRISLPGLAYARITTDSAYRAVWLPLFVSEFDSLRELVELHAGPRHPLTQLLNAEAER